MLLYVILLFQLVFFIDAQVARKGKLSMLKSTLQPSLLKDIDSASYTVINLPKLDNCALVLQTLLHGNNQNQHSNIQCGLRDDVTSYADEDFRPIGEDTIREGNKEHSSFHVEEMHEDEVFKQKLNQGQESEELEHEHVTSGSTNYSNLPIDSITSGSNNNLSIHSGSFAFGRGIPVDINVVLRGTWYPLKNGMGRILKLGIKSPTAFSLNLLFDRFWLPTGAELYIHGQTAMLGAYTASVNNKRHMKFATTPLPGSFLLIEYYSPEYVTEDPILHISSVVHGFRPVTSFLNDNAVCEGTFEADIDENNVRMEASSESESMQGTQRAFFNGIRSGCCNINTPACSETGTYLNQTRSVAIVMTSNGQKFCSGSMINNQLQDGRQLFLTADHCVNEFNSDFRYNILGFNYQSKICSNNPNEWPLIETTQGLKLLGRLIY